MSNGVTTHRQRIEQAQKDLLGTPAVPSVPVTVDPKSVIRKLNRGETLTPAEEQWLDTQGSIPAPLPSKMVHGMTKTPKGDIGAMRGKEAKALFPKVGGKSVSASSYFKQRPVRQKHG